MFVIAKGTLQSIVLMMLNQLIAQTDTLKIEPITLEPKFEYQDCGCKIEIDLIIHYGLYGNYGGQSVPNKDEKDKGAVTVANLNDTNGNDKIDADEWPVLATDKGRDEIDLMALIIKPIGKVPDCPFDNVILEAQGNIKFWESNTKSKEITSLSFPINTLPRTIWVEATQVSSFVRDIVIRAYINNNANPVQDEVKATAIWCEKQKVYYRDVNNTPLSRLTLPEPTSVGIDNPDLQWVINDYTFWHPDLTRYGFGVFGKENPSPGMSKFFGGRVLFEFITLPIGIEKEFDRLDIKMDISRRKTTDHTIRVKGDFRPASMPENPSKKLELPNDDPEDADCPTNGGRCDAIDEDAIPKNKEIFSYDSPSLIIDGINVPSTIGIYNGYFNEYCRVSFREDVVDNIEEGSKCSEFVNWHLNLPMARTKSLDQSDPYNFEKTELELVTNVGTISTIPTLSRGMGNGTINIEMLSNHDAGYWLEYETALDRWKLICQTSSNARTEFSNNSAMGPWEISTPGWIKVKIENNNTINFSANTVLLFNSYHFDSIIQEFKVD